MTVRIQNASDRINELLSSAVPNGRRQVDKPETQRALSTALQYFKNEGAKSDFRKKYKAWKAEFESDLNRVGLLDNQVIDIGLAKLDNMIADCMAEIEE